VEPFLSPAFFLCPCAILFLPVVFLALGWRDLRARRYDRASTYGTLAGVASWILLGLDGVLVTSALLQGVPLWEDPWATAVVSYPPVLWVMARALYGSIARHREEDRAAWRARRKEERELREDGNR
jgi:Na+/proline symporter